MRIHDGHSGEVHFNDSNLMESCKLESLKSSILTYLIHDTFIMVRSSNQVHYSCPLPYIFRTMCYGKNLLNNTDEPMIHSNLGKCYLCT